MAIPFVYGSYGADKHIEKIDENIDEMHRELHEVKEHAVSNQMKNMQMELHEQKRAFQYLTQILTEQGMKMHDLADGTLRLAKTTEKSAVMKQQ